MGAGIDPAILAALSQLLEQNRGAGGAIPSAPAPSPGGGAAQALGGLGSLGGLAGGPAGLAIPAIGGLLSGAASAIDGSNKPSASQREQQLASASAARGSASSGNAASFARLMDILLRNRTGGG